MQRNPILCVHLNERPRTKSRLVHGLSSAMHRVGIRGRAEGAAAPPFFLYFKKVFVLTNRLHCCCSFFASIMQLFTTLQNVTSEGRHSSIPRSGLFPVIIVGCMNAMG